LTAETTAFALSRWKAWSPRLLEARRDTAMVLVLLLFSTAREGSIFTLQQECLLLQTAVTIASAS
jgi:hypothetical protein